MKDQLLLMKKTTKEKAIVLFSGGLDSTTLLYYVMEQYEPLCIAFNYGQRHNRELSSAREITQRLNLELLVLDIPFPDKGSALLDRGEKIPEQLTDFIPITYVPGRNTVFIALALSYAEAYSINKVFIAVNAIDYSGYPDCRPEYISKFNELVSIGTKTGVNGKAIEILAPFVHMTKADIIKLGMKLAVPYELTWSCYKGEDRPCGVCDSCRLRLKGFEDAGFTDPLFSQ